MAERLRLLARQQLPGRAMSESSASYRERTRVFLKKSIDGAFENPAPALFLLSTSASVVYSVVGVFRRLDSLEHRMESLEHRMESGEHRMESVEHRMASVEERIGALEHGVENFERNMGERLGRIEHQVNEIRSFWGGAEGGNG